MYICIYDHLFSKKLNYTSFAFFCKNYCIIRTVVLSICFALSRAGCTSAWKSHANVLWRHTNKLLSFQEIHRCRK